MVVKIAPEAAFDTAAAATATTKQATLKNEIVVASIGQAGAAADAAMVTKKARPSSAPPSREASAPLSAFEAMETFTPRVRKVDSSLAIAESESPTAVIGGGNVGGLSPLSSISSMPSSAATAVAAALEEEAAAAASSASAPAPASLPPFAEGSRLKILNRMGINVRPTNDMVLIQRTANVERRKPDHCGDYLACKIRDVKMPFRAAFFTAVHFGFRFNWWLYSKVAKAICPGGCNTFDARTRWFDEAVLATLERREFGSDGDEEQQRRCDTVVALAAGFDTRCLRLSVGRPGVRFIELDLPHVSEKKRRLVEKLWPEGKASSELGNSSSEIEAASDNDDASPSTSSSSTSSSSSSASSLQQLRHPVFVGSDMLDPARASRDLAAAGWRRNAPCATTIEGLLYYLPLDKAEAALETVARTVARGSTLAFDFWPRECLESGGEGFYGYKRAALMVADLGEPFLSGFPHEAEEHAAYAARFGFRVRELLGPEEIAKRYFPHKRHEPSRKKLAVTTFMYFALWEKV